MKNKFISIIDTEATGMMLYSSDIECLTLNLSKNWGNGNQ